MHRSAQLVARLLLTAIVLLPAPLISAPLDEAEAAREAAFAAGAETLVPEAYARALKRLTKARDAERRGQTDKAAERAAVAAEAFAEAELLALQASVLGSARAAYREADVARARRFAPRTMGGAATLLTRSADELERTRTATAEAATLAAEAEAAARLAIEITRVAREKPSVEDLLLQHRADLERLQSAAGLQQSMNRDLLVAVSLLEDEIVRLRDAEQRLSGELADSRAFAAALDDEIRLLDERLGSVSAERRELVLQREAQARRREQLVQVRNLFTPEEAEVLEQSGTVIVRLVGARFASGSPQLEPDSLAVLDKAAAALAVYPGARVVIEGHTDSKGSERLNQRLSQNRAQTVLNELIARTGLAPGGISAVGYGESRPVANNETAAGRAVNRRIDLVIVPPITDSGAL